MNAYLDLMARLQQCEIMSEGRFPEAGVKYAYSSMDEADASRMACTSRCARNLSCAQLKSLACEEDPTYGWECVEKCAEVFKCADGSGMTLLEWKCDGYDDCDDGSDEVGCPPPPTFRCDDGSEIPERDRCDSFRDCDDGSDEDDCPLPPTFRCKDGSDIPENDRCDGSRDCDDGSDEDGCPVPPMFQCADGEEISAIFECDGDPDCDDGSDETGCAVFQCE
jgi:hypothetical protein